MNCATHTQTPATAFCRTCGKALCEDCKRDVMGAIYCEPCIAARLQGAGGPAVAPPPAVVYAGDTPSPVVAAVVGLIPGVGAWYNGQFVRGFLYVVVFAMLIVGIVQSAESDKVTLIILFSLLTGFFPIYMCFEAYSTAKARQMGKPAPDPLGLDRLLGSTEPQPATAPGAVAGSVAPYQPAQRSSEPVGAIILIVMGVLFMLGNMGLFHYRRLFIPMLLIGLGVWIAYKRTSGRA